jgi:hypothetical protein
MTRGLRKVKRSRLSTVEVGSEPRGLRTNYYSIFPHGVAIFFVYLRGGVSWMKLHGISKNTR